MGDSKLASALKPFCEKLRSVVENGRDISVITHLDADGITSGSIIATALMRACAKCSVRTVSDMTPSVIERMKAEDRDFYVITDLGGGMAANFRKALKDKWVVIDHHQIPGIQPAGQIERRLDLVEGIVEVGRVQNRSDPRVS